MRVAFCSRRRPGNDHIRFCLIFFISTIRRGNGSCSIAAYNATIICRMLTSAKALVFALCPGINSAAAYNGKSNVGHQCPGPNTYQGAGNNS